MVSFKSTNASSSTESRNGFGKCVVAKGFDVYEQTFVGLFEGFK